MPSGPPPTLIDTDHDIIQDADNKEDECKHPEHQRYVVHSIEGALRESEKNCLTIDEVDNEPENPGGKSNNEIAYSHADKAGC
jgi:hypothetical protein